ncbi:MAG: TRAP transporter substrate-binding protein DctP, partial [Dehalococcoidia bacterium]|nr:TRAP transporter substrate-binding protein DctP [Dehalococcoidia bacterium]
WPTLNLKFESHLFMPDIERGPKNFCTLVEKLSQGKVKISLYPGGAIVPPAEMLNALRTGILDIVETSEGYFAGQVPGTDPAGGLPFAFRSVWESWMFMWHRGYLEIMREQYAKHNAYFLPWECSITGLMTKKPINQIDDLKGMKIRGWGSMGEWVNKCGASTVMIPGGELYAALATGVADGAHWGDAGPSYLMKLHEVLKYYMVPEPIQGNWLNVYINMNVWNKFSPEEKLQIELAAMASSMRGIASTRVMRERCLDKMVKDFGVTVVTLPPKEIEKGTKLAVESWQGIANKNPVNAKVVEMIKAFMNEKDVIPQAGQLADKL